MWLFTVYDNSDFDNIIERKLFHNANYGTIWAQKLCHELNLKEEAIFNNPIEYSVIQVEIGD